MRTPFILAVSAVSTMMLSGCVAALLPLAAAGAIGKGQIDRAKAKRDLLAIGAVDMNVPNGQAIIDPSQANGSQASSESAGFKGKGGAIDFAEIDLNSDSARYLSRFFQPVNPNRTPYAGFAAHALEQAVRREEGAGVESVVLIPRVDIFKPETVACAGKPLAVLIDLDDETNANWTAAATFYRQNGLVEALRSLRASQISVIWISDNPVAASPRISVILEEAGFSESEADDFLILDRGGDDRKQIRRWDAARSYCVVAIAGDDRADFDELYDYLRSPDGAISLEHMFGNGWFLTPPPLIEAVEEDADAVPAEAKG